MRPTHSLKNVKSAVSPQTREGVGTALGQAWAVWLKLKVLLTRVAVEPIMLLDGLAYSVMIVYVENLQMDKICRVNLNLTEEICGNLSAYPDHNLAFQQAFSMFGMYNGIIMAFLPLFFILFMGAWSDKYGRKVPLVIATVGHFCWAGGYLLNAWVPEWPVEYILVAALLDSIGGGNVSFLTAANAYISDVTSEESRTSRVGLANSIWYLGGPIGTLVGTYIYKYGGYKVLFGTSVLMHTVSLTYLFFLPESHGPFKTQVTKGEAAEAQQPQDAPEEPSEDVEDPEKITVSKMIKDFFSYDRILDSFRCTFKSRGGMVRAFILLLILCNLLRRLGRGAYMFLFTRKVLHWKATDYGLWVTYKNLLAALGSLVAVPLLSTGMGVSDSHLAILGAVASVLDYTLYGLVSESAEVLVWIAPATAILVNSCVIAIRSMLSKFVQGDELGKVSAVMGALDGVMPMISFSLYTAVYHATVHVFPAAQFFFGASANLLMTVIFVFIIMATTTRSYSIEDLQGREEKTVAVTPTSLRFFSERLNRHLTESTDAGTRRSAMVLSNVNFHIATPRRSKKKIRADKDSVVTSNDLKILRDELPFAKKESYVEGQSDQGADNPAFVSDEEATTGPHDSSPSNRPVSRSDAEHCVAQGRKVKGHAAIQP